MLWPKMVSVAGPPGLAAVGHLFRLTRFWGENSAELPSFKMSFLRIKPIPPPKQPVAVSESQPQRKEDKASRKRGKEGCCAGGETQTDFTLVPKDGDTHTYPRGLGGHRVTEGPGSGHTEKRHNTPPPCYFCTPFSPPRLLLRTKAATSLPFC